MAPGLELEVYLTLVGIVAAAFHQDVAGSQVVEVIGPVRLDHRKLAGIDDDMVAQVGAIDAVDQLGPGLSHHLIAQARLGRARRMVVHQVDLDLAVGSAAPHAPQLRREHFAVDAPHRVLEPLGAARLPAVCERARDALADLIEVMADVIDRKRGPCDR